MGHRVCVPSCVGVESVHADTTVGRKLEVSMIDPSSTDAAIHSFVPLATACLPDLYTLN